MTRAATKDPKLLAAADQKQVTIKPMVVIRYTGRLPYLTANAFQIKLPNAMATMTPP